MSNTDRNQKIVVSDIITSLYENLDEAPDREIVVEDTLDDLFQNQLLLIRDSNPEEFEHYRQNVIDLNNSIQDVIAQRSKLVLSHFLIGERLTNLRDWYRRNFEGIQGISGKWEKFALHCIRREFRENYDIRTCQRDMSVWQRLYPHKELLIEAAEKGLGIGTVYNMAAPSNPDRALDWQLDIINSYTSSSYDPDEIDDDDDYDDYEEYDDDYDEEYDEDDELVPVLHEEEDDIQEIEVEVRVRPPQISDEDRESHHLTRNRAHKIKMIAKIIDSASADKRPLLDAICRKHHVENLDVAKQLCSESVENLREFLNTGYLQYGHYNGKDVEEMAIPLASAKVYHFEQRDAQIEYEKGQRKKAHIRDSFQNKEKQQGIQSKHATTITFENIPQEALLDFQRLLEQNHNLNALFSPLLSGLNAQGTAGVRFVVYQLDYTEEDSSQSEQQVMPEKAVV